MAWVRPKKKPAPKKIVDPEARRNTLHYFSCGHQPQKRNHDRLKSSDLVILEPKRQRNPLAYLDENDPLVKSMLASQRNSSQSKSKKQRTVLSKEDRDFHHELNVVLSLPHYESTLTADQHTWILASIAIQNIILFSITHTAIRNLSLSPLERGIRDRGPAGRVQ
ncbi:MAG: hypothetical protein Q9202_007451 [Teloschistes flavicans]